MDNKDYLILTKGLPVCLVLDTVIGLLNEIAFEVSYATECRQNAPRAILPNRPW